MQYYTTMLKIFAFFYVLSVFVLASAENTSENVFTDIYQRGVWGSQWFSGGGAETQNARSYVSFLQKFLRAKNIKTVVDVGCGDWQFSQYVDWNGITYTGYDVVKHIIEINQERFAEPGVVFIHADVLNTDLPQADLLICKDVLQHLSNSDVKHFLQQLQKFQYCLITNDIERRNGSANNIDIERGAYRPLDLTMPPFNLKGKNVLLYQSDWSIKQVFLVEK